MDSNALKTLLKDEATVEGYLLNLIKNSDSKGAIHQTVEYLKRILSLEEYWKEVKENDKILSRYKEKLKNNPFFKNEMFYKYE